MNWLQLLLLLIAATAVGLLFTGRRGPSRSTDFIRWSLVTLTAILTALPFLWLVTAVFKDPKALLAHTFLPPLDQWSTDLNLKNFHQLFQPVEVQGGQVSFWLFVMNSLLLSSIQTVVSLVLCSLGGYALAKHDFAGRKALLFFMIVTLMVPSVLFLAPLYKMVYQLGWLNTWSALIIPGAVSAFGIFLFRQAMVQVPDDLIEAARMDGAGEWRIWWQVMMPLVRPMSGAFCLMTFLGSWNSFLQPTLFLSGSDKLTLPVVLNGMQFQYSTQYGVFLAATLVAIIPPAILFFALQREFVSGLTSGAVKG